MFFDAARRAGLVDANPFADVTTPGGVDDRRKHYVGPADTARLIAAASPTWRVIVALARFAGLRCPSEVLSLKWADVNFETDRTTVPVPKLEHLAGKEYRVVPVFAARRPHLAEAFELAADGAEYVVPGDHRERPTATAAGTLSTSAPSSRSWCGGPGCRRGPGCPTTCGRAARRT